MKALVWLGDETLLPEEVSDPQPDDSELVLDIRLAWICGSDLQQYRGGLGPRVPPLSLGYEAAGTVAGRGGRYVPFRRLVEEPVKYVRAKYVRAILSTAAAKREMV